MLADRRKKVIYSNPRGLLWAKDEHKFGQRMLKSMGWQEGKGLGKNQDGITENIKASFKFDSNGFGYKRKLNDWIEDNNAYEQILSELAQHHGNQPGPQTNPTNNVQKTKSGGRIPYRKFIKAKNLSLQSEKDLFQIFPTSKASSDAAASMNGDFNSDSKESASSSKCEIEENTKSSSLITVESNLSIQDYFKQKMQQRLSRAPATSTANDNSDQASSQADQKGPKRKNKKHKSDH